MTTNIDFKPIQEIQSYDNLIVSSEKSSIIIDLKRANIKQNQSSFYIRWVTLYVGYSFIQFNIDQIKSIQPINNQVYVELTTL